MCGCGEAYLGVILSQSSRFDAPETQDPSASLLSPWRKVSRADIFFPLLRSATTLLLTFWPYSRPGACWTVPAVPDLLAWP